MYCKHLQTSRKNCFSLSLSLSLVDHDMAPQESAKVRDEGQDLRTEPLNSVQSAIFKEPWNVMHMSYVICHAYVMQCSYQIRFQTQFRSQRRCNNRLCGDAEPCSNLQQMCDSQQQHIQHVHNIFTTCSNQLQTQEASNRNILPIKQSLSTCAPLALHLLVANLASASNSSKSQLSPAHGAPIWEGKRFWTIFGQYLDNIWAMVGSWKHIDSTQKHWSKQTAPWLPSCGEPAPARTRCERSLVPYRRLPGEPGKACVS